MADQPYAAQGTPPDWWLYVLLSVHRNAPDEQLRHATEIVKLLATGGIKVKMPWRSSERTLLPLSAGRFVVMSEFRTVVCRGSRSKPPLDPE